jgi:small nuclear ribonucleoprotein (snRNP)-like protein
MSARLVKKVLALSKDRHHKPVVIGMRSGRTYVGELVSADIGNGIVEIQVTDSVSNKSWTALLDIDLIEAVEPRWDIAA